MSLGEYLKNHKKTYLIFDFDDTLVHLNLPWDLWEKDIKNEFVKTDKSIYVRYQDNQINLSQLMNAYITQHPKLKDLIITNCLKFEKENLKDFQVNHQLLNLVENVKGYQLFLWTSQTKPTVQKVLQKLKIQNKFKRLVTRNDVSLLKPDPEGFYQISDPAISNKQYLLIGDSQADQEAAQSVGIDFYLEDYFK